MLKYGIIGESLEYEGYSFCVYGAELYKYYDFKDDYNYVDVARIEVYLEENDTHMLMVNLKVKNITDEANVIKLCSCKGKIFGFSP